MMSQVGCLQIAYRLSAWQAPPYAYIEDFYLAPHIRGRGVGPKLLTMPCDLPQPLRRPRARWPHALLLGGVLLSAGACSAPAASPLAEQAVPPVPGSPTVAPTPAASPAPARAMPSRSPAPSSATPYAMSTASPTVTRAPSATPTPTQQALQPFEAALAARLQQILDETVANGQIPGAIVSVAIRGYEPWNGASGVADRQPGRPLTPETNLRIASISKIFTAIVVLQLVEEGALALDDPLAAYLPGLVPNAEAIRVHDLLQHTTGLYDYLEDRAYVVQAYRDPQRTFAPQELVAYATQFPPAFAPGTPGNWDYSSTNYVILGMLVERLTGNPLGDEMRRRIFTPLALEHTFFAPDPAIPLTAARGYGQNADQTNVVMSFAFATANLVSTPDDVRRFIDALLGGQLLQPATPQSMLTIVNGKGQYNMPELEYGLGSMRHRLPIGPAPDGQPRPAEASRVVEHIGGFGGFRSAERHARPQHHRGAGRQPGRHRPEYPGNARL